MRCARSPRESTYLRGTAAATAVRSPAVTRPSTVSTRAALAARATPPLRRGATATAAGSCSFFEPVFARQPAERQTAGWSYETIVRPPRFVRVTRAAPSGVSGATSCATRSRLVSTALRSASTTARAMTRSPNCTAGGSNDARSVSARTGWTPRTGAARPSRSTTATATARATTTAAAMRVNAPTAVASAARPTR